MEFSRVLALRGPNVWARFPVLEAWIDLQHLKDAASSEIPGFNERLRSLLPSLIEHRCSVGERGGFFQRLERGTYLAHILEHVVLELQTLAGTEVGFGRTRMTSVDGVYRMALEYHDEDLARAALEVGKELCLALVAGRCFDVAGEVGKLRELAQRLRPAGIVQSILEAARARRVPARLLDPTGLVQLGYGARQRRVLGGQTDGSSAVGNSIAYDRELSRTLLQAAGVPVPWGRSVASAEDAWAAAQEMGLPAQLRPRYVSGLGAVNGPLETPQQVEAAYALAVAEGWSALVEHRVAGDEYRLLVVGKRVVAARRLNGSPDDMAAQLHPAVAERAVDAVQVLGLEVAGVDIVASTLEQSLEQQGGCVVSVVGQPDLGGYLDTGTVGSALVEHLFPEPKASRIPIVGVTGVNGKTTTTRLTAHLLAQRYAPVGMSCTEGIYVGERRIMSGDCSGPKSARVVLQHSEPQAAVLETARGGILREGLGFDRCDVAVVTNIGDGDHLGCGDIDTTEQLAWVKSTLVWAVAPDGYAVLNAADPLVVDMARYCDGQVIYFARRGDLPVLLEHRRRGGRAVFVRNNSVILAEGNRETELISLEHVPLTHGGRVGFHVENTLAATAAAWGVGLTNDEIRAGLESFCPGMDNVPARFNLLDINGVTVVLDYGHNTSALAQLIDVLSQFPHERRAVVYSAAGDRRDCDIVQQGAQLGSAFDRVYIYEDTYLRGRQVGEISRLFRKGMAGASRVQEVQEILGGMKTIEVALESCEPGDLLVVQPDLIDDGVALLRRFLEQGGREIALDEALSLPMPAPGASSAPGADIEVRESRLGVGVYAAREIPAGEVILRAWGPTTTERSKYTIQVDQDLHLIPPEPLRFLNHSCEPNCGLLIRCGVQEIELHTLRPLQPGEELTLDYETFEVEFEALKGPCLCQSPSCRGTLVGYRELPQHLRDAYGVYVAEYLREADVPLTLQVPVKV
jgi:cyanophycin synthetase